MVLCAVEGCISSYYNNFLKRSFHSIPKASYNHWARICHISGGPSKMKNMKVCSLHFEDHCFIRTGPNPRLRNNVVPTLLLPPDCLTSCLICLQTVEDPSTMSSLNKILSVQDNMNFSICDLIYSIANVKLEVEQNVFNICPTCVNGVTQAFKYQQLCVNAGKHQLRNVNTPECDAKVKTAPNIKMEEVEDESIDISETFISCGTHDEDDSDMFEEEMESQEIEIKLEPIMEHSSEEAEGTKQTIPLHSQALYEEVFDEFEKLMIEHQFNACSEKVLLTYIKEVSKKFKPSSFVKLISILRATLKVKNNVDIFIYGGIHSFMKQYENRYKLKETKMLSSQQINTFIAKADDYIHLFTKVVVIMGICGSCSNSELYNLKISEIEDSSKDFLVTLHDSSAKKIRSFVIPPSFYGPVRKYLDLRPSNFENQRFFINYFKGICTTHVAGIHTLLSVPRRVAEFLKLPNPERYTGHTLRRSAKTFKLNTVLGPEK